MPASSTAKSTTRKASTKAAVPAGVLKYQGNLVHPGKKAYAASCVTAFMNGEAFPATPAGLMEDYAEGVRARLTKEFAKAAKAAK